MNDALKSELHRLLSEDQAILAIKTYRDATGCDLVKAKRWYYHARAASVEESSPGRPCPYCGKSLRSDKAQQCFECGMDWHGFLPRD